jgi:hypothetical protein
MPIQHGISRNNKLIRTSDMYPLGLIDETIRTLALLFPSTKETRAWFKQEQSKKEQATKRLDSKVVECGLLRAEDRQIDEFSFWRDRLVMLKQVFDEKEPGTWPQWWHDRRRGLQRYPFLLAAAALALTLLLGTIQVIEGGVQVYKAFKPARG